MKNEVTFDDRHPLINAMYLHLGVVTVDVGNWQAGVDGAEAVILMNQGAAAGVTLPSAAASKGKAYWIKKVFAAAGAITITAQLGDNIDGAPTNSDIALQYDTLLLVSDGSTGWWILAAYGPSF